MELNKVHNIDFLSNNLPDKCANLIIADPPYFQVKGDFDFAWDNFQDYLKDVERWAVECKRLLADNGTILWYGHAKKIAYSQLVLDKYFNLLNALVWQKKDSQTLRNKIANMRTFIPVTERILMYGNCTSKTGLQKIHDNPDLFLPIKQYMREQRANLMISKGFKNIAAFNKYINKVSGTAAVVSRHYFADSQYAFPTKEIYKKLQNTGFWQKDYEELRQEYDELLKEYEELRQEYELLRRPFNLMELAKKDVLTFSQEAHITKKYKHPTKKPETLTRLFIKTCSRKGDLVLVPFAGSGTECAMSLVEGRKCIGFDVEPQYVELANARINKQMYKQPSLLAGA